CEALYCTRIGLLFKERCPAYPIVFDVHGVIAEEETMAKASAPRIAASNAWERRALEEADLSLFVSEAMHTFLSEKHGIEIGNMHILPCCAAEAQFPRLDAAGPVTLPDERTIVAYVGTLAAWQCGEEMFRLFAQLLRHAPELHFLLLIP